ncbi:innexin inx2-like [Ostrinia furnacalis]|uniref:innexin inx2-like n=1 Tax=Ostrinia furnacalis TaxID=93504 RepID=UPI00103B7C29|nr:innexin inx2-like [Ostrinia furnacalis]
MIDLFMPFRAFLKFENVCTDNNIFRMHYKATVIMLLVFTLMVTSKQFFGEPIHCMSDSEKDSDKDAINSYCWIYGTYTLKSSLHGVVGKNMAYPGVGPLKTGKDEEIKHTYYQWVCFVLLGQSVMFYTPRYLWKIWEGGRLKALASDLSSPLVTKDWSEFRRGELVSYLSYTNIYTHNMYALRYAFCELLNLANVVGQIFLLDIFLGGAFRNYGAAVAAFTHTPRVPANMIDFASVNPMDQYFPKLTKCWLRSYGPTGTLQLKDRLCVLPLNIVNEKIFVILWFWLIFLAFMSTAAVLFRFLVLSFSPLRTALIMAQLRYINRNIVSRIVKRFGFGDWFILYLLGNNMNPIIYKELLIELSKELEHKTIMV